MNLFQRAEQLGPKMKWHDFGLLKGAVFFFTLFLLTAWDWFANIALSIAWYWYLIIAIGLSIPLMKKMFSDE